MISLAIEVAKVNEIAHNYISSEAVVSPSKLSALRQTVYIMKCLIEGQYLEQIVDKFERDKQLVDLWMS